MAGGSLALLLSSPADCPARVRFLTALVRVLLAMRATQGECMCACVLFVIA